MAALFNSIFVQPLYSVLVWLGAVLPGHNLGLAIIALTLGVRLVLFPLQHRMMKTQKTLKTLEPEIKRIRSEEKDQAEQARKMMALYREHGVNPLAGFLLLLIQIPVLLALFFVFRDLPASPDLAPTLFGLIDLTNRNYFLAVLAGVAQWGQLTLARPPLSTSAAGQAGSPTEEMGRKLTSQMRWFLPIMIVVAASSLPAAIGLYWLTSNLFSLTHEWWVRRAALKTPLSV